MKQIDPLDIGVLLVDDELFIRATFKRMLGLLGCTRIQEAGDGTEAVRLLAEGFRPDLVISDVQMAPMDGLAFVRKLRSLADRAQARVPVIMLTAVTDKATKERTSDLDITSYLLKPVTRIEFTDQIHAIFPRAAAARLA